MKTIKLTAKRQATFPRELCEGLGLEPGDEIELVAKSEKGEPCWMLKKRKAPARDWIGSLRRFASDGKDHSMDAIRGSIAAGRKGEA